MCISQPNFNRLIVEVGEKLQHVLGEIFFILAGIEDNSQIWTEFELWPDRTKGRRVTALDWCQKLVFAQYLENGWTEFDKICIHNIIDKIYVAFVKRSFFRKFSTELQPLIDARNWFLRNIVRMDGQNFNKFCIHTIIDKIYVDIVKRHFSQI